MKHAGPIIVGLCLIFLLGSCVWAFFSYARTHDLSGAQKKLKAKGLLLHSYGEFYGRPYDAFTIEVTYTDPASAEGPAIEHWALTLDGVPQ